MAYKKLVRRKVTPASDLVVSYQQVDGRKVCVGREFPFPDLYLYIENGSPTTRYLKKYSHYNVNDWSTANTLAGVLYRAPISNPETFDYFVTPAGGYYLYVNPTYTIRYVPDKDRIVLMSERGVNIYTTEGVLENSYSLCYSSGNRYITAIDVTSDNRFVMLSYATSRIPGVPILSRPGNNCWISIYDWSGTQVSDYDYANGNIDKRLGIMKVAPDGRIYAFGGRVLREFDTDGVHLRNLTNYTDAYGRNLTTANSLMGCMAFDSQGNIILGGMGLANSGGIDSVWSIAQDGNVNWSKFLNANFYTKIVETWTAGGDECHNLFVDSNNDVIAYGKGDCNAVSENLLRTKFNGSTGSRIDEDSIGTAPIGYPDGYEMAELYDYDKASLLTSQDGDAASPRAIGDMHIHSCSHLHELMETSLSLSEGFWGIAGVAWGRWSQRVKVTAISASDVTCTTHPTRRNVEATFTVDPAIEGAELSWRTTGVIIDSGTGIIGADGTVTVTTDDALCVSIGAGSVTVYIVDIRVKQASFDYTGSVKSDTVAI